MDGSPRRPLPHQRGLALVRDTDRRDPIATHAGGFERILHGDHHALPDLVRLVLDEARRWKVLAELARRAAQGRSLRVHHERRGPGRSLIDGKEKVSSHAFWVAWSRERGKAATMKDASPEARSHKRPKFNVVESGFLEEGGHLYGVPPLREATIVPPGGA